MQRKCVFISGANSGIGLATANVFARYAEWRVVGTARDLESARAIPNISPNIHWLKLDLADAHSVQQCAEQLLEISLPQVIVHNAGMQLPAAAEDTPRTDIERQFSTNVAGTWQLTNEILPQILAASPNVRKQCKIIFVGSVFGYSALPFRAAYVAVKHAIEGYALALKLELAGTGISVGVMQPGPVATPFRQKASKFIDRGRLLQSRHAPAYENVFERLDAAPTSSLIVLSSDQVARRLFRLARKSRLSFRNPVGILAQILFICSFLPFSVQTMIYRIASRRGRV